MQPSSNGLSLRAGLELSGLSIHQIWGRCVCVGGNVSHAAVQDQITSHAPSDPLQHNLIAHVLNEYLADCGFGWPVAYAVPDGWAPSDF